MPRVEAPETSGWEKGARRAWARAGRRRERERVRVDEDEGEGAGAGVRRDEGQRRAAAGAGPSEGEGEPAAHCALGPSACATRDGWLYVSEVVAPELRRGEAVEIEDEVRGCFKELVGASALPSPSALSLDPFWTPY